MFNIKFRVVIQHTEEAACNMVKLIRQHGIKVYDVREADIVWDKDGSYCDSTYILCCETNVLRYKGFKNKYKYDETIYEGFKTLR
jgi:hypothetical protein